MYVLRMEKLMKITFQCCCWLVYGIGTLSAKNGSDFQLAASKSEQKRFFFFDGNCLLLDTHNNIWESICAGRKDCPTHRLDVNRLSPGRFVETFCRSTTHSSAGPTQIRAIKTGAVFCVRPCNMHLYR